MYGCLVAGAVGDALGAPAEGLYRWQIRERYGRITDLLPYDNVPYSSGRRGMATYDTALRYYICLAVTRKGGRITPDDAAQVWFNDLNPERFAVPDRVTWLKLKAGVSPWDAGRGNIPSACATMAMAPIGIINAGNAVQAYQDGLNIAFMDCDRPDRDAAATLAAGIAAAFIPSITVASVLETMTHHGTQPVRRAIELTMDLAQASDSVDAFAEEWYDRLIDWWSRPTPAWTKEHYPQGTSTETVSPAMAILHLCNGDVNRCLVEGANFGRDADAIASLSATLAGAMQGANAIRADWVEAVERANEPFFAEAGGHAKANFRWMAQHMVEALKGEQERARARASLLATILAR